jgi:adenosine deaminase
MTLNPDRLFDGWGAADAPDVLQLLTEREIPLDVSMARALCFGAISTYAQYPLRHLYDEGVKLTIGSDMPSLYKTSLSDEYLAAVEHVGFAIDELEELALNAIRFSLLPAEDKETLLTRFTEEYAQLRSEHITTETT